MQDSGGQKWLEHLTDGKIPAFPFRVTAANHPPPSPLIPGIIFSIYAHLATLMSSSGEAHPSSWQASPPEPSWSSTCSLLQKRTWRATNMDLLLPPELISWCSYVGCCSEKPNLNSTLRWGESCCVCPPLTWIWFLRSAATTAAHLSGSLYFLSTKTIEFSPNYYNCSQRLSLDSPTDLSTSSPTYPNLLGSVEVWGGRSITFVVPESFCPR